MTSVDAPLGTQPASNRFALAQPFLVAMEHGGRTRSIEAPMPTITTAKGGAIGVVEPFVLGQQSGSVARDVSAPTPTIAADGAIALIEPFIVPPRGFDQSGRKVDDVDSPLRTVTAVAGHTFGVVEPLIAKYNSTAVAAKPVSEPLDTISTRDRFALVQPVVNGYVLDIKFRMLQPHELAAAMSFPKSYVFTGNKGDQIRQIGNAVDCRMAQALCGSILDARAVGPIKKAKIA